MALFRTLLSLLFLSTFLQLAQSTTTNDSLKTYKKFIKDQCNATTYPMECYKALSPYASKIKRNHVTLTKLSINVALKEAKIAKSTLKKLSKGKLSDGETSVIDDCRENIDDTLDLLQQSSDALAHLNGNSTADERFQWDNIKTWVSGSITDESTCIDEFDEIQVRSSLQKKIKTTIYDVSSLISIALAFVNTLF
ncbi:hypothetical protein PHAVU_011G005100 [Phaseolus vulgaris]|uniref:Pectinesterase inhibitor domain-containing protein n=1 Tax=Phaseolus vulgaris TaxID=3885 RepID=V7AER0_PHAVU|nr:hypothetical protein PHAVU_011G005100g [Phaseolus vulgaris]ESW03328.1 hypothetical protein PHAVU_011G005100g [Phaseolus vulgaris]